MITGLNASTLYYVRVRAGNAEGNSSWSSTSSFTTLLTTTNNPPTFTSSSTFSVPENIQSVGTVVASDDGKDSVTGYRISGGVDAGLFAITNAGVLSFRSAPDLRMLVMRMLIMSTLLWLRLPAVRAVVCVRLLRVFRLRLLMWLRGM